MHVKGLMCQTTYSKYGIRNIEVLPGENMSLEHIQAVESSQPVKLYNLDKGLCHTSIYLTVFNDLADSYGLTKLPGYT